MENTMNYELSRIRLCSVGPAGARFQDVTLDLSGAGRPVAQEQADLFDSVTQTLRPSPASAKSPKPMWCRQAASALRFDFEHRRMSNDPRDKVWGSPPEHRSAFRRRATIDCNAIQSEIAPRQVARAPSAEARQQARPSGER